MTKLTNAEEDYLEAIFKLSDHGYARIKDISEELNVKPPSVTSMAIKLLGKGLIFYRKNSPITLTDKGRKLAKYSYDTHQKLKIFLRKIGVPEELAEKDACEMEHQLSRVTVEKLGRFVEKMR